MSIVKVYQQEDVCGLLPAVDRRTLFSSQQTDNLCSCKGGGTVQVRVRNQLTPLWYSNAALKVGGRLVVMRDCSETAATAAETSWEEE